MDKIPSIELYAVARNMRTADNYPDWFETVGLEETYG
jgi:hypothetical protein